MNNLAAKKLWGETVVANPACLSDPTTAKNGLNNSRSHTRSYRLGEVNALQVPYIDSIKKRNLSILVMADKGTSFSGVIYPGLAKETIDKAYLCTSEKKLDTVFSELDELAHMVPDLKSALCNLKAIAMIISKTGDNQEYPRFKQALKLVDEGLAIPEIRTYWKRLLTSTRVFLLYKLAKYYDHSTEGVTKQYAQDLLPESLFVAECNVSLMAWINHLEIASVAESVQDYDAAIKGINEVIEYRTSNQVQQEYVRQAVDVVISERDGSGYREDLSFSNPEQKIVGDPA